MDYGLTGHNECQPLCSSWRKDRPGWHIEDIAITETYFGPQYDIHVGAMDLSSPDEISPVLVEAKSKFLESMDNDFNTPNALRAVFDLVRETNRRINEKTIS